MIVACLTAVAGLYPAMSMGCESAPSTEGWKRMSVGDDCSFQNGGRTKFGFYSGQAVVDIGGGRIGQRLTTGDACTPREYLFFMNCGSGEGIVIVGQYDDREPGIVGMSSYSIDLIQKPIGPIGLTSRSTVQELGEIAVSNHYQYTVDLSEFFSRSESRKRIDYSCGCNLYYPDTPGAKS